MATVASGSNGAVSAIGGIRGGTLGSALQFGNRTAGCGSGSDARDERGAGSGLKNGLG